MTEKKKMTAGDHGTRALAAASQGARDAALPGIAGLGLLGLAPMYRKLTQDTKHVPSGFQTKTQKELGDLIDRLLVAGGRDPEVGKELVVNAKKPPGFAEYRREFRAPRGSGRKARDFLYLGLNATPESVSHEIGHATGGRFGKALNAISQPLRTKPALAVPALLAATALLGDPDKDLPMVAKAAPYIGGAMLATVLAEEVRANMRGLKLLKQIGYKTPINQQIGRHAMALSYLGKGVGMIAAPLGILAGIKAYNKAKQKDRPMTLHGIAAHKPSDLADAPSSMELQKKWAPLFNKR